MRTTVSPTPLVDDLKCLASAKPRERRSFASIAKSAGHASCRGSCLGWTVHRRFDKCTAPGRLRNVPRSPERRGCVAQLVEQLTLNQRVQGSNPCTPTNDFKDLAKNWKAANGAFVDLGANLGATQKGDHFGWSGLWKWKSAGTRASFGQGSFFFSGSAATLAFRRRRLAWLRRPP